MKFCVLISACLLAACVESGANHSAAVDASEEKEAGKCQDADGDGYGESCDKGGDCNDADAKVHTGCARCVSPAQGCDCEQGTAPVSCYLTPSRNEEGAVMCHEGTRYCRDHAWSACESIVSYPKPAATESQALIKADAGPVHCNDCNVNCYVVRDNLDPVDGGFDASSLNTTINDGGGLSLKYTMSDAAVVVTDAGTFDPSTCVLGTAPDHDCDGIPDKYDPYPDQKPFATANPTIFLDIAPGETGTGVVNVQFYLNSADVYFLIDQTGSMSEESAQLKSDLTTGDFINNAAFNCSDYDFDFQPNNELKAQGIIGAIRCIIRDANFGVGYFREIPFAPTYGPNNTTMFRNLQDITTSIPSVISGVSQLTAVNNIDWPEADMVALYSVATGSGAYFGTDKPGLLPKSCAGTAWGYPCFRSNAIPIVIMFTDAMMHNGPSNNAYAYAAANLGINKGTTAAYTSVTPTNENIATALDLGDVTTSLKTYIGSNTTMTSDLGHSAVPCGSSSRPVSPDALFKFSVSATTNVTLAAAGTDFSHTISLYNGVPGIVTTLPALPNTNDTSATAFGFGDVGNKYLQATGSTSGLVADYSPNDVACAAYPNSKDATFTFSLAQATRVALDTTGSTIGTVVSLFNSAPTATTYTAVTGNDAFASAYSVGALDGKNLGFSGDSSTGGIVATYTGAQLACGTAPADSATDAVYSFSLATPRRVRISAEDTTFANAIALIDNGGNFLTTTASPNTNELETSATDIGALDNKALQYTGTTASMAANYTQATIGCNAQDASRDAVYKFSLTGTKTVSLDTTGSAMDTTLALFRNTVSGNTYTTLASNANETGLTAYSVGTVNNKQYVISGGSTSSMTANYTSTQIGCSTTNSTAPDAVFKFHLDTATKVHIDTTSTTYDAQLSLHNNPLPDLASLAIANTNEDGGSSAYPVTISTTAANLQYTGSTSSMATNITITSALCTATGRDAVFKLVVPVTGDYQIDTIGSGFDTVLALYTTSAVNANLIACDNNGGGTGLTTSKIMRNLTAGTYYIVVKGLASSNKGSYKLNIKALDYIDSANRIACDDDSAGSSQAQIEQNLAAGDYYVVVKGHSLAAVGAYTLSIRDASSPPASTEIVCNDDVSASSNASLIVQTLPLGTYYVVLKGHATSSGSYTLTMKDTTVTNAASLQCDTGSGVSGTSLIERDLTAGTYRVIFKGKASTNKGAYKLIFRDLTALPNNQRIGCDHNSGTGSKSHYEADLTPGTYTAVVKGDSATAGAYKLSVRDATLLPINDTPAQCNHNGAADGTAIISTSLTPGTYYAAVKGYYTENVGQYQLTIGGAAATTGTYVPPTWAQTLAALQAKQVRVMPVLSCADDTSGHGNLINGDCNLTRTQATALANATGALGASLQPLVFDISSNGSGLSTSVVNGIASLAHYLSMDVQVRVVFDPDANPGFGLAIKAVDTPGDGCSGLVGIEHKDCVPGATPRFEIAFNNPLSHPVPLNPHDPNGGYNFRAELIGDNEFIVDRVPIYIVPRDVTHPPAPVPQIVSTGSYWQNIAAPGCVGNQRPDWHDLSWTADIPNGTTLGFSVCASDKASDLTSCPLISLCNVTGGGTCTTDANCTNGYCSTSGNCQTITAGACTSDMQCTSGSVCRSNKCTFLGQPVYVGGVLGSANYEANLRMQISMTANVADNTGPTMHDWSLTYVCNNIL